MAIVTISDERRTLTDAGAMAAHLAAIGIDYERWESAYPIAAATAPADVLQAYQAKSKS
jgi:cupin superfamily acireductone dioxygenase involved in methionine salvage